MNETQRSSVCKALLAVPRIAAPFALLLPWAVVPSHLGEGAASFSYFWHWLTKYPNFGPINFQVFLGIVCVLATALLPVVFQIRMWGDGRHHKRLLWIVFVCDILMYAPQLLWLDLGLWRTAELMLILGPALRVLAISSMAASLRRF